MNCPNCGYCSQCGRAAMPPAIPNGPYLYGAWWGVVPPPQIYHGPAVTGVTLPMTAGPRINLCSSSAN